MREDSSNMFLVTSIPGRIRMKIPDLYKNPNLSRKLQRSLMCLEGITNVQINVYTKSLLVKYDLKKISFEKLLGIIESKVLSYRVIVNQSMEMVKTAASTSTFSKAISVDNEKKAKYSNRGIARSKPKKSFKKGS